MEDVTQYRSLHHPLFFFFLYNLAVASCKTHKHLDFLLDKRLTFDHHVKEMILRANKGI